jgi:hypothetical protein
MSRIGHKRNIKTTILRGIKYFDMYVKIDDGFIATKGEFIIHCRSTGVNIYGAAVYRDRQKTKRCIGYAGGGSVQWCRTSVIELLDRVYIREQLKGEDNDNDKS